MTKIFTNSALFYDAINKEYKKEAAYVVQSLREFDFTAKKILELGCGTGNYSFILRDHGYEVLGIDASKEMISLAKKKQPCPLYKSPSPRDRGCSRMPSSA